MEAMVQGWCHGVGEEMGVIGGESDGASSGLGITAEDICVKL